MAREADPPKQLENLRASLEKKGLAPAYVFRGEERYFRERAAKMVLARAGADGLDLARHDGEDPDFKLSTLLDDLSASPMFASARCVYVLGVAKHLKKAGREDPPLVRAIASFIESSSLGGTLVLDAESLRADHKLVKAAKAAGGALISCRKLYDAPPPWASADPRQAELVQWFAARARAARVRIDADEALYLVTRTGNDLHELDALLEKLRHAPGAGRERLAQLGGSGGGDAAASPWSVAEAICVGDRSKAWCGIERLFRSGFVQRDGRREQDEKALSAVLISSVRSKLRQTARAAHVMAQGGDMGAALEAAGVGTWPKARAEFEQRLRARRPEDWSRMLTGLLEIERRTRQSTTVDANDFFVWVAQTSRQDAR